MRELKFKVGDRVKILPANKGNKRHLFPGYVTEGEIFEIDYTDAQCYHVEAAGFGQTQWCTESEVAELC